MRHVSRAANLKLSRRTHEVCYLLEFARKSVVDTVPLVNAAAFVLDLERELVDVVLHVAPERTHLIPLVPYEIDREVKADYSAAEAQGSPEAVPEVALVVVQPPLSLVGTADPSDPVAIADADGNLSENHVVAVCKDLHRLDLDPVLRESEGRATSFKQMQPKIVSWNPIVKRLETYKIVQP